MLFEGKRMTGRFFAQLLIVSFFTTCIFNGFMPTAIRADGTVSRESFREAIIGAGAIHSIAVEGTGEGQYEAGSKTMFESAIDSAEVVYNDASATQQQIDQANAALSEALQQFDSKRKREEQSTVLVLNDTYEGEIIGSAPDGYDLKVASEDGTVTYGTVTIEDAPDSSGTCMKYDLTTGQVMSAGRTFTAQTGKVILETRIWPTSATSSIEVFLGNSGTINNVTSLVSFWFRNTNRFLFHGNGTPPSQLETTFAAGQWYDVKVVADIKSQTCEFYVNDTLVGTLATRTGITEADRIIFQSRASSAKGALYVDYLKVTGESGSPLQENTDASLSSISVADAVYSGFSSDIATYDILLPKDTVLVPEVRGEANDVRGAVYGIPAASLPGTAILVGIAEDRKTTKLYNVNLAVTDTTLLEDVTLTVEHTSIYETKSTPLTLTGRLDGVSGINLEQVTEADVSFVSSNPEVACVAGEAVYGVSPGQASIHAVIRLDELEVVSNSVDIIVEKLDEFTIDSPTFTDINGQTVGGLKNSGFIQIHLNIQKNKNTDTTACLIAALYDSANSLKRIGYVKKNVEMDKTESFSVGFDLPEDTSGHKIKVLVWDSLAGMKPLSDVTEFPYTWMKTEGSIANAPLQVGVWRDIETQTPSWIFPMINILRSPNYNKATYNPAEGVVPPISPEALADQIIAEYNNRPQDQPIWLHINGMYGRYKNFEGENVLAFIEDFTGEGTPTIWPDNAVEYWKDYTERMLNRFVDNEMRLDMWAMDHETRLTPWNANFGTTNNTFKNIVLDPRWSTQPILGLGITGSQLLDPSEIGGPNDSVFVNDSYGTTDSTLAVNYLVNIGRFYRPEAMNKVYTEPLLSVYPHAQPSDYGIAGTRAQIKYDEMVVGINSMTPQDAQILQQIQQLVPGYGNATNGVGDIAAPALYGGSGYENAADKAVHALNFVDDLIEIYGSPEKVIPWIAPPNYGRAGERHFTPDEYERMLVGMAERGIRKIMLWNSDNSAHTPEMYDELLNALQKAYNAAEIRLNEAQN